MFRGILRVLKDLPLPGCENMARDEALLSVGKVPTLRFFSWDRPTLSLGKHQKEDELDFSFLERAGIPLVRRPTGGRAILHGDEVTFSFFLPRGEVPHPHRLLYDIVREVLRKAFADLGLKVDSSVSGVSFLGSPACFSLALPHEVAVLGKKVAGIAQARTIRGNLFEGSIPFSIDRLSFASCFREKERIYRELEERSAGLRELRADLTREELMERMVIRFGELFEGVHFGTWEKEELLRAQELLGEKYVPSSHHPGQ